MTTQQIPITTEGAHTYTAPANLVGGNVVVDAYGAAGAAGSPPTGPAGHGDHVNGTVPISAGATLDLVVGDASGHGYHPGGSGSAADGTGGNGGGSTGVSTSGGTLLIEAAGGGGSGAGADGMAAGGQATNGSPTPGNGYGGASHYGGAGPFYGGAGGGGGGNQGDGQNAPSHTTGNGGGVAPGGAGGEAAVATGPTQWGGGGGAGALSYVAPTVAGPTMYGGGGVTTTGSVLITQVIADAPNAPTLSSPAPGAYLDADAEGVEFVWVYNPGLDSGTQAGYQLRVLISGSYQYWNATSGAFQGSPVWNTSATPSVGIPAALLPDGVAYQWSVATEESYYDTAGPFASDQLFYAESMPTVTVVSPTGTTPVASPTVSWTETLGGGASQTAYRVCVYTLAVTEQAGFAPGATTATVDSGMVASAALSYAVPSPLEQNEWVVYVQVTETGGVTSIWTSSAFTVGYDQPATPTITAASTVDPTTGMPTVTLNVTTYDNLLSANDASFEGGLGSWIADPVTGSTVSQSSAEALDGAYSMAVVTSVGAAGAVTGSNVYPVTGGVTYAAIASVRAATGTTPAAWQLQLQFYTALGATVGAPQAGTAETDTTTGWTELSVVGSAPSTAAFVQLQVVSASMPGTHYVDCIGLYTASTVPAWSAGGYNPVHTVTIVASDDGGTTWVPVYGGTGVPVPAMAQQISVVDYCAPFGAPRLYQATVEAPVTTPLIGVVTSDPATVTGTAYSSNCWLTNPNNPAMALQLSRVPSLSGSMAVQSQVSFELDDTEELGTFYGFATSSGADTDTLTVPAIVQHGAMEAPTFTVNILTVGYNDWTTWRTLRLSQTTLLYRTDMGEAYYIAISSPVADVLLRASDRVVNPTRVISFPAIVTSAPADLTSP